MSLRVFHAPGAWTPGQSIELNDDESRYLLRVRRARPGTPVEVLDATSACWTARVHEIRGHTAVLELLAARPIVTSAPRILVLVVPEPRATLESVTHATEMGATEIWLVRGDHSPGGVPSHERLARTVRASLRQCGRACPPQIHGPAPLTDALHHHRSIPGFVAQLNDRHQTTLEPISLEPGARLLVGPEGGLSPAEQAMAYSAGFMPLWLGPWVLRTPTAVTAGLARLWIPDDCAPIAGPAPRA